MAKNKRLMSSYSEIDREKLHGLTEAVSIVKSNAKAKFDETIEVAVNLNVDPRHADQMVRGVCSLPNGTGRSVRVAVFARGAKAEEAKKAGADVVGGDELAEEIQNGRMDFDKVIATPDMMPVVGRLGKVLGPRGMMPNPKVGTVTMDVNKAIQDSKGGAVEFRVEKAGIIHAGIGELHREGDRGKPAGVPGCHRQGEAVGRQGHLSEEDRRQLHHGAGRQG